MTKIRPGCTPVLDIVVLSWKLRNSRHELQAQLCPIALCRIRDLPHCYIVCNQQSRGQAAWTGNSSALRSQAQITVSMRRKRTVQDVKQIAFRVRLRHEREHHALEPEVNLVPQTQLLHMILLLARPNSGVSQRLLVAQ